MYFFKVVLSLFDEDKETIFLIPNVDMLEKNELPVFSENELTAHSKFTEFVKRTKTAIVDVEYELYEVKDVVVVEEMNESEFEQLLDRNKLVLLDSNDFCIQIRKIKYKRKKGNSLFPKIGIGAAVLLLIAGTVAKKMRSNEEPTPEPTSEITSDTAYSSEDLNNSLGEPPIDEIISSVPEVTESTTEISSVQSTVQLPESTATSTTSTVQTTPTSPAISSATTSTAAQSTVQSSSAASTAPTQSPTEATSSR